MNSIRININRPPVCDETELLLSLYEQKFMRFNKNELFKIINFAKTYKCFFIIKDKNYFVVEKFADKNDLIIIKQSLKAGKKTLLYDGGGFVWLSLRYINALLMGSYKQTPTDNRISLKEANDLSEALQLQQAFYNAAKMPRIKKTKSYLLR